MRSKTLKPYRFVDSEPEKWTPRGSAFGTPDWTTTSHKSWRVLRGHKTQPEHEHYEEHARRTGHCGQGRLAHRRTTFSELNTNGFKQCWYITFLLCSLIPAADDCFRQLAEDKQAEQRVNGDLRGSSEHWTHRVRGGYWCHRPDTHRGLHVSIGWAASGREHILNWNDANFIVVG